MCEEGGDSANRSVQTASESRAPTVKAVCFKAQSGSARRGRPVKPVPCAAPAVWVPVDLASQSPPPRILIPGFTITMHRDLPPPTAERVHCDCDDTTKISRGRGCRGGVADDERRSQAAQEPRDKASEARFALEKQ